MQWPQKPIGQEVAESIIVPGSTACLERCFFTLDSSDLQKNGVLTKKAQSPFSVQRDSKVGSGLNVNDRETMLAVQKKKSQEL